MLALRTAKELKQLHRVILGTDSPAGSGVQPLGILRMISMLSSLGEIPAEVAICLATGNTAKMRSLDCGLIAMGAKPVSFSSIRRSSPPARICSTAFKRETWPELEWLSLTAQ